MTPEDRKETITREALGLGFHRVAFAVAGPARHAFHLDRWLARGFHGKMEWMARSRDRRADPCRILPGARTVVSLLTFYFPSSAEAEEPEAAWTGRVSRYARGSDYHNVLRRRLRKLARVIERLDPEARTVAAVDDRPVLEKEWAQRTGLGWIGKHSNLITPDRGSWCFLSELLTELAVPPDDSASPDRCGKCTECLGACPTGAIVAPYVVDARRCISYLTIELDGPIPRDLRPLVGEWIFGCDVCQEVCPWNRFAVPVTEPRFRRDAGRFAGGAVEFLSLTDDEFRRRFEGSPVRRAGRDGFLRNVCVALGNRGDPSALPPLGRALEDASPLVRGHAAWALGRIGGREAEALLRAARAREGDRDVRSELDEALRECHASAERI